MALVTWTIHRQRVRRQMRKRRRVQDELNATTTPRKRPPGYDDEDMIEATDTAYWYGQSRQPIPAGLAERFRRKDTYIKAALGEAYPMHTDVKPEDHSKLLPASPPPTLSKIDRVDELDSSWNRYSISIPDDGKISSLLGEQPVSHESLRRPPALHLDQPRWSWTNSQAPATPRMYVPTIASSRNSATRFRMAVNWVKTQGERIS